MLHSLVRCHSSERGPAATELSLVALRRRGTEPLTWLSLRTARVTSVEQRLQSASPSSAGWVP